MLKCELYHDNFQNYKRYSIPRAQLVIADIPYNLGVNAYGFEISRKYYAEAAEKMLTEPDGEQIELIAR